MLPQRKWGAPLPLEEKRGIKKGKGVSYFKPLPYSFIKSLIPIGHIILTTIFVSSLWYYLMPIDNNSEKSMGYKDSSDAVGSNKKPDLKEKRDVPIKVLGKKRNPIVKIGPSPHKGKRPNKKSALKLYNQAVMNDKMGNYKVAIQYYKQALGYKNPKIQAHATGIRQRINYLMHHKLTP